MDDYIPISAINDFLFCPHSLYYHGLYTSFDQKVYQDTPQVEGTLRHATVHNGTYSTRKDCLQGMFVYCEQYLLVGKIDTFFADSGELIERKSKVKHIYDGYKFQLFAQFFALSEMGYTVNHLSIHSLTDNKHYSIELPNTEVIIAFESTLKAIRSFDITKTACTCSENKHHNNIYKELY